MFAKGDLSLGLVDYYFTGENGEEIKPAAEVLKEHNLEPMELLAKEDLPLENNPNEVHSYNNTGYVLLAAIIESVSGKSFEEFIGFFNSIQTL